MGQLTAAGSLILHYGAKLGLLGGAVPAAARDDPHEQTWNGGTSEESSFL
jgi:hypothetical protein